MTNRTENTIDTRSVEKITRQHGFTDYKEGRGYCVERIEELRGKGFDLIASSPRGTDVSPSVFSIKVMKKSDDPEGEIFAYAHMSGKEGDDGYFQFGFFADMERLQTSLGLEKELELGELESSEKIISYAHGEISWMNNMAMACEGHV